MVGQAAGIIGIGVAFAKTSDYIKQSVVQVAALDDATRKVGAKIDVGDTGLGLLRDNAREVGLEFNTMAEEVAEAQNYLALAGFDLNKTLQATDDLVAVQKASGESMAVVADIITDVSTAYRYSADELGIVGDMAVYTSSKFNTSVGQLGEAYKYVVPVAKNANLELSDLNGYLGVLANNAIKGSMAGTVMRSAVTRLTAPTKAAADEFAKYNIQLYDSEGNFKGFNQSMKIVEASMKNMNEEQRNAFMQTVFGQEAISGLNVIFNEGVDSITDYGNAIEGAEGKAKDMATFMEEGIGGALRANNLQMAETKNIVGTMFEGLSVEIINDLTEALKNANDELKKTEEESSNVLVGTYDALKEGAQIVGGGVGGFLQNTASILNFATGGLFGAPGDVVSGVGGGIRGNLAARGENVRLGLPVGRGEAGAGLLEDVRAGRVGTGLGPLQQGLALPGQTISAPFSLTINTGGAPLTRDDTDQASTVLKGAMDQWWDQKLKESMNGLR